MIVGEDPCLDLCLNPDAGINDERDGSVGSDTMFEACYLDSIDISLLIIHGMVFLYLISVMLHR
jgi:hypothetical protein